MRSKPQTVTVWWCDKCNRFDYTELSLLGHFSNGHRCDGEARPLTYGLVTA